MVNIKFGMNLDGARWSEKSASLGTITCGPLGMLKFLETRLGLGGLETAQAERIGAYLEKVRSVYQAEPTAWGAESFRKDYWTTAKRLLAWRDELVDAGWDGKTGGSDRLDLLAKIEAAGKPTPAGTPDRVKAAVEKCTKAALAGVTVTLVDDAAKYTHYWRVLFDKLDVASNWSVPELPKTQVEVIDAANEIQLAALFVQELKAQTEAGKKVAVIAGGDTTLLDGMLHRAGMASIGQSLGSGERAAIQILPLWVEYMWEPFSPLTLLSILKSEVSPFIYGKKVDGEFIPVGRRIIDALSQAPGIGGEAWEAAWADIGEEFGDYRKVLEAKRFDPEGDGIPYEEFEKRIDWLVQKLGPKVSDDYKYFDERIKGMLKGTIQNAALLKKLAKSLDKINRITLRRLMETIIATGEKMPGARHEVAAWAVYKHPAQIMSEADTVLWWNFCDDGAGRGTYWTEAEREALGEAVEFDTEKSIARETDGWYNALARAKSGLKLYHPMTAGGEECASHPFLADLIRLGYVGDEKPVIKEDDSVTAKVVEPVEGEEPEESLAVQIAADEEVKPRSVSASQLTTLLSCPFKWYFEKHIGLKQADALDLPTGAPMIGLLAHKVVETIIKVDKATDPGEAGELAKLHFNELLPQMAAELLSPDRTVECEHYRRTLQESVAALWKAIKDRELTFVEAEKVLDKEKAFDGLDFFGRADIVLQDKSGKPYVIDLKWAAGAHYIEAAEGGKSVQLATYAWAIDPANKDVKSAYYMFPKKNFFENPQSDTEVWEKIKADYTRTMAEIRRGELHRGYVGEESLLGLEPGCRFCPFTSLCGKER